MINLLSPQDKKELRAARLNVLLRRYAILIGFTLLAVIAIFGVGIGITYYEKMRAESSLQTDHSQTTQYETTRQEAEQFENNLNIANRILANEISYSSLLIDIAKALPDNAIITSLSLNPEILNKATTLEMRTVNYESALALRETLERSEVFNAVSIQNIITDDAGAEDTSPNARFPVRVMIEATIAYPPKAGGGQL